MKLTSQKTYHRAIVQAGKYKLVTVHLTHPCAVLQTQNECCKISRQAHDFRREISQTIKEYPGHTVREALALNQTQNSLHHLFLNHCQAF